MSGARPRRDVVADHTGAGAGAVEKSSFVGLDAHTGVALGHCADPTMKRRPVGERLLGHHIEVNLGLPEVERVTAPQVVPLIDRGWWRQTQDQWHVMVLVI